MIEGNNHRDDIIQYREIVNMLLKKGKFETQIWQSAGITRNLHMDLMKGDISTIKMRASSLAKVQDFIKKNLPDWEVDMFVELIKDTKEDVEMKESMSEEDIDRFKKELENMPIRMVDPVPDWLKHIIKAMEEKPEGIEIQVIFK